MRFLYTVFALLCVVSFMGARQMVRGYPLGVVNSVDRENGVVSVDLGSGDGVRKGIPFSVVDKKGRPVAAITAQEVYDDMFWSGKLAPEAIGRVRTGMQVRWVFTPEVSALLAAVRKNTVEGYGRFIERFPASPFLPELVRDLPEETVKELSPEYYEAWSLYTKGAFEEFIQSHPGSGFAYVAKSEIAFIDKFEAEKERRRLEREKQAEEYAAEQRRQEEVQARIRARQDLLQREETMGRLVNNSGSAVRFEFEPPSNLPPRVVETGVGVDVRHPAGTYKYKVFAVGEEADEFFSLGEEEPAKPTPLKEGEVSTDFDFWEVTYP